MPVRASLVLLLLLAPAVSGAADLAGLACAPHPPILVEGDVGPQGLLLGYTPAGGAPLYRPGTGIVRGSGAPDDPLVIEGWCVQEGRKTPLSDEPPALRIAGTTLHVLVRATTFPAGRGIEIEDARDVTLETVTLSHAGPAVGISESSRITIARASFLDSTTGVAVDSSDNVTVRESAFEDPTSSSDASAILATDVADLRVEDNRVAGHAYGLDCGECPRAVVVDNMLVNTTRALRLFDADDAVVANNTILGAWEEGVYLQSSEGALVEKNQLAERSRGIRIVRSGFVDVRANVVDGGILWLLRSTEATLVGNAVDGSISIDGDTAAHYLHQVAPDNLESGVPLRYYRGLSGGVIHGGSGHLVVTGSSGVVISGQVFEGHTLELPFDAGIEVKDSVFSGGGRGIHLRGSSGGAVHHNRFDGASTALYLDGTSSVRIEANVFDGHGADCTSIQLYGSPLNTVVNNTLAGCRTGIEIGPSARNNVVSRNTIRDHHLYGIRSLGAGNGGTTIEANNITGNAHGVSLQALPLRVSGNNLWGNTLDAVEYTSPVAGWVVDARGNWWGCAAGPTDSACDGAGANVAYSPWLSASNTSAGAR